ncbi:hypothetical protein Tco_0512778, partial [Tanacetum coccineum]
SQTALCKLQSNCIALEVDAMRTIDLDVIEVEAIRALDRCH